MYGIDPTALAISPSQILADEATRKQIALETRRVRLAEKRLMLEDARATRTPAPRAVSRGGKTLPTIRYWHKGEQVSAKEYHKGLYEKGEAERKRSFEEKLALKRAGKAEMTPEEAAGWEEKGWAFGPKGKTIAPKAPKKPTLADKKREDIKTVFLRAVEGGQFKTQQEAYIAAVGEKISEEVGIKEAIMSLPPEREREPSWWKPKWMERKREMPSPYGEEAEAVGGENPRFPAVGRVDSTDPVATRIEELRAQGMPDEQIAGFLSQKGIDPQEYGLRY